MPLNKHLDALTGLRGISALMVIVQHSLEVGPTKFAISPSFLVAGDMSVYFFFVLSGFLLTYRAYCEILLAPKTKQSPNGSLLANIEVEYEQIPHPNLVMPTKMSLLFYFIRRIFRIYPAYALILLFSEGKPYPNPTARFWKRLFMLNTEYSYFWTIRVEMACYMFIPVFQVISAIALNLENKYYRTRIPFHLLYLCLVTSFFLWLHCTGFIHIPFTDGYNNFWDNLPVFWYGSLAGTAYFYLEKNGYTLKKSGGFKQKMIFFSIELASYFILFAAILSNKTASENFLGTRTWWCETTRVSVTPLYALMLVLLSVTQGESSVGKFFACNFWVFTGKISYSMYLVNYNAITLVNEHTNITGFEANITVIFLECIFGWLLHTFVEETGVKLGNYFIKKIKSGSKSEAHSDNDKDLKSDPPPLTLHSNLNDNNEVAGPHNPFAVEVVHSAMVQE